MAYDLLVVVPYRDRRDHLERLAPRLEEFLAGKQSFRLAVIEQTPGPPFNRGKLINVGFLLFQNAADQLVMHDVDMLPLNASCDYNPTSRPVHLAGRASQFNYALPYATYVGGVLMIPMAHFEQINGFSNEYWGWGREDDDLWLRLEARQLHCARRTGLYQSLPHKRSTGIAPACARRFVRAREDRVAFQQDGLRQTRYEVLRRQPLVDYLTPIPLGRQHEIITVDLLYE